MILVAGATGQLGGTFTRRLLEQGKDVLICAHHDSSSVDRSLAYSLD